MSIFETPSMKAEAQISKELGIDPVHVCTVGSTLICGKGNDIDLLCLVPSDDCLIAAGFSTDIEAEYESDLASWRRGNINIIAVRDRAFFLAEVAIAYGAQTAGKYKFDMTQRDERVAFHSRVRSAVLSRHVGGLDKSEAAQ